MAHMICPECQHAVSTTATKCPNCGYKLKKARSRLMVLLAFALGVFALIATGYYLFPAEITNDPMDGSIKQVKQYIACHVDNPESIQYVRWGRVKKCKNAEHAYKVGVEYRIKNATGTYARITEMFYLNRWGNVGKVERLK